MKQRSEGATVLLGMSEFVVGAQLAVGRGLWLMVETTCDVVGCEGCGTRAVGHGRRRLKVQDLPMADRPVVLVWANDGQAGDHSAYRTGDHLRPRPLPRVGTGGPIVPSQEPCVPL